MKTLYAMLAGMMMFASVPAMADVPQCPDHPINASEMSACHKERVTAIFGDDYTGKYGSFWVTHVNGEVVAIPSKEIQQAGSEKKAIAMIEQAIHDKLVEQLNDEIAEHTNKYNELVEISDKQAADLALAQTELARFETDLAKAKKDLADLQTLYNGATKDLGDANALVITLQQTIANKTTDLTELEAAYENALVQIGESIGLTNTYINEMVDDEGLQYAAAAISTLAEGYYESYNELDGWIIEQAEDIESGEYTLAEAQAKIVSHIAILETFKKTVEDASPNASFAEASETYSGHKGTLVPGSADLGVGYTGHFFGGNAGYTDGVYKFGNAYYYAKGGKYVLGSGVHNSYLAAAKAAGFNVDIVFDNDNKIMTYNDNTYVQVFADTWVLAGAGKTDADNSITSEIGTEDFFEAGTKWKMRVAGEELNIVYNGNKSTITLTKGEATYNTMIQAINGLAKHVAFEAYSEGYDKGYADGYKDGYVDGFADGVNSVK